MQQLNSTQFPKERGLRTFLLSLIVVTSIESTSSGPLEVELTKHMNPSIYDIKTEALASLHLLL